VAFRVIPKDELGPVRTYYMGYKVDAYHKHFIVTSPDGVDRVTIKHPSRVRVWIRRHRKARQQR
jgi:hypothetical protein